MILGNDNKLYLLQRDDLFHYYVIENANEQIANLKLKKVHHPTLQQGNIVFSPTIINYPYLAKIFIKNLCHQDTAKFYVQTGYSGPYYWDFGDGKKDTSLIEETSHYYQTAGVYKVSFSYQGYDSLETSLKEIVIHELPKIEVRDTLLFNNQSITVNVFDAATISYLWSNGDTNAFVKINSAGKYQVLVKNKNCQAKDSFRVHNAVIKIIENYGCNKKSIPLKISYIADSLMGEYGLVNFRDTQIDLAYQNAQKIKLRVFVNNLQRDTLIDLILHETPKLNLGNDSILCQNNLINLGLKQTETATWQDGSSTNQYAINQSGTYTVVVKNNDCAIKDTVTYYVINCKLSGENLCKDDTSKFGFTANVDSIAWNFGDVNKKTSLQASQQHVFSDEGTFNIKTKIYVKNMSLALANNILIGSYPKNHFSKDTLVCKDFSYYPIDENNDYQYLWSNGLRSKFIKPTENGIYTLALSNKNCSTLDTIKIQVKDCDCPMYVPTAFTPNSDGINDYFNFINDCEIKEYELMIFDKWGGLIYKTKANDAISWDGKNSEGEILPTDSYLWTLRYIIKETNKQYFKFGSVLVLF